MQSVCSVGIILGIAGRPDMFKLTRKFIGDTLEGLTHEEVTPIFVSPGTRIEKPVAGSPYEVISCEPVEEGIIPAGRQRKV